MSNFGFGVHVEERARAPDPLGVPSPLGIAVQQRQVPRTGRDQVRDQAEPEAAQPAGHEIGCIRIEERPDVRDREPGIGGVSRRLEHQFAPGARPSSSGAGPWRNPGTGRR